MNKMDWLALAGYLIVAAAFSMTLYATFMNYARQKHGELIAQDRRRFYNVFAAFIGAAWPISLPTCAVLATVAIMVGRKR